MRGFVDQRQERVEFVRPAVEQVVGVLIFMFEGYCDASLTSAESKNAATGLWCSLER